MTPGERVQEFYRKLYQTYGANDPRSLSWISHDTQEVRFQALLEIGNLHGKRILDYGCGFGDLYGYLQTRGLAAYVEYHGVDIMEEMVYAAQKHYPDVIFAHWEEATLPIAPYDYIFASGVFSLTVPGAPGVYYERIGELFSYAKEGMAFNVLHKGYHPSDETYFTYDPNEVLEFCQTLTPYVDMTNRHLYYDCTFHLYKKAQN